MSAPQKDAGVWSKVLEALVSRGFVVLMLVIIVLGGSLVVVPFDPGLGLPRDPVPVDAIPDIGENQQIVFTDWPGRSPRDVEDQISYPMTTALLGVSGVKSVRSFSMLGFSTVYVIFEEDVAFYWSRARLLEKLASLPEGTLPAGITPRLGPDSTALGQVFWYTLEGRDAETGEVLGGWSLEELRSIQDWQVRYALASVPGVSEVSSVGGHVMEYQVDVNPEALRAHSVDIVQVAEAVRGSNMDVGARTIEINRVEYLVRGLGFIKDVEDLEQAVVAVRGQTPIRVRDVARVALGPASRRGALDNAGAEAVGGVVVARFGENPLDVIEAVKDRIESVSGSLPVKRLEDGRLSQVRVVPFYDRSTLINETLGTLTTALWQQILITIIVVLILLGNLRSSALVGLSLPVCVLATFLMMKGAGVEANVMSLAGIAIAIGTMVDMGIVVTENIVRRLREAPADAPRAEVVRAASVEVAPAVFTSTATTLVSFLPVFALTAAEGKLFRPLAYTKTFAIFAALLFALVVLPVLAHLVLRRRAERRSRPAGPGAGSGLRRLLEWDRHRDWIVVTLGVALAVFHPLMGLTVLTVGILSLVQPLLPGRFSGAVRWGQNAVAAALVLWLLTGQWLPLGPGSGLGTNLLFVAGVVGGLLGVFLLFLKVYADLLDWALSHKALFLALPVSFFVFGFTAWIGFDGVTGALPSALKSGLASTKIAESLPGFGREFMPPFDEGSFLYMPTTMPHASIGEALDLLSEMDAAVKMIPEVEEVVGKVGRVDSALDPAPVSMVETLITYKAQWKVGPDGTRVRQWRDHIHSPKDIWREITRAAEMPGLTSAPELMPINTRVIMLQTGMRAPLGLKVRGPDLASVEAAGLALEGALRQVPSIRAETVFAERIVGKPYLEIEIDREAIARHGLTIEAVQRVIQLGLGGATLTTSVEGRRRLAVRVRYMREERDSVEALHKVIVPTMAGHQVPLEQLADFRYVRGPQVIKSEDTFLTSYVIFDKRSDIAETSVVEEARALLEQRLGSGALKLPEGVSYTFAGSYENQVRSEKRLKLLVPLALALILILLYLQFRRLSTTLIIYSGVAVAVSGGFILIWLYAQPSFMDFTVMGTSMRALFHVGPMNMSVAVWVGFIALMGIATDDGVVMATYLRQSFDASPPDSIEAIRQRVKEAGARRVRPCLMTTATTLLALLPVITSQGRGADVMGPMAIPCIGGMSVELVTLFVVPVLYSFREESRWRLKRWRGLKVEPPVES